jgi:N-methylhydantoinase A
VPLERCVGVRERIGPDGVLEPLDLGSLPDLDPSSRRLRSACSSRFATPAHERAVARGAAGGGCRGARVASHEVSPEFREYERASTAATDAYLGPVVSRLPRGARRGRC